MPGRSPVLLKRERTEGSHSLLTSETAAKWEELETQNDSLRKGRGQKGQIQSLREEDLSFITKPMVGEQGKEKRKAERQARRGEELPKEGEVAAGKRITGGLVTVRISR